MIYFKAKWGVLRSRVIYYLKPFNTKRLISFYSKFISKGDLCFDIGANVGNRTAAWSKMGASVICIDPQPHCVTFLKRKFAKDENVVVLEKGVGAKIGKKEMSINTTNNTISTFADKEWKSALSRMDKSQIIWDEKVDVDMVTIEYLVQKYGLPGFCKIDVEGFEVKVLTGMVTPLPSLSFEILSDTFEETIKCLSILDSKGNYQYNISFGESQVLALDDWVNSNEMSQFVKNVSKSVFSGDIYAQLTRK